MIRKILAEIVSELETGNRAEALDMGTVKKMQEWMEEIDHETEVVPLEDKLRLTRLVSSLKGGDLNEEEHRLVAQIIEY